MPDVLVLGADGFIGSHVTDALLERGMTVRAFDRIRNLTPRNLTLHPNLELVSGDFLNRSDLDAALRDARTVIHLISTTTPATSGNDVGFDVETNVRGSVELMEACVRAGIERIIFASTGGAIYGRDQARPFTEDDAPTPVSPYAIGKLAIEGYLRFYHQAHGLDYLTLRISNPYGERQAVEGAQGAIPIFLNRMLRNEPITVFGDGSMVRDYLYVGDLAQMVVAAVDTDAGAHLFNVGSGDARTVIELIGVLEDVTGLTARVQHAPDRPTDVHRVVLDCSRFESHFGVRASTPLERGIEQTYAYVRDLAEMGR